MVAFCKDILHALKIGADMPPDFQFASNVNESLLNFQFDFLTGIFFMKRSSIKSLSALKFSESFFSTI